MSITKRRPVEAPSGRGEVFKDDKAISQVRYSLYVYQDIYVTRTPGGVEEVPGLMDVSGIITVITGERNLMGVDSLTLHLADGRVWTFFAKAGDPVSGEYECVNASGEGLTSH